MQVYRNPEFTGRVAEVAQDFLDDYMLGIRPMNDLPTPGSNLGRAGMSCGMRAHQLLDAMHDADRAYWQICSIKLPKNTSNGLEGRLDRAMNGSPI